MPSLAAECYPSLPPIGYQALPESISEQRKRSIIRAKADLSPNRSTNTNPSSFSQERRAPSPKASEGGGEVELARNVHLRFFLCCGVRCTGRCRDDKPQMTARGWTSIFVPENQSSEPAAHPYGSPHKTGNKTTYALRKTNDDSRLFGGAAGSSARLQTGVRWGPLS